MNTTAHTLSINKYYIFLTVILTLELELGFCLYTVKTAY